MLRQTFSNRALQEFPERNRHRAALAEALLPNPWPQAVQQPMQQSMQKPVQNPVQDHLRSAESIIDDFCLDTHAYRRLSSTQCIDLGCTAEAADGAVEIYQRGMAGELQLRVSNRGTGNRIYLNNGVSGALSIGFGGSDSLIYLGHDVSLSDQHIGSRQDRDFIAVGNDVASTGPGRWVSGLRSGAQHPAILIGDSCVIARDVVIRNSDGHPIMDPTLVQQLNEPASSVLIEPHVWLGERCAILKGVTVGAFARIAFGSVVTHDVPRHYTALGSPAQLRRNQEDVWAWDDSPEGLDRAREFLLRYPRDEVDPKSSN
ncbi:MAG: hypothetical protein ACI87W_002685 [Halieaceae bacterium]|jgi:hypothetical protein